MTRWIATRTRHEMGQWIGDFEPLGLMARGTLLIETAFDPLRLRRRLASFVAADPWPGDLSVWLMGDGTLEVNWRQADRFGKETLVTGLELPETCVRIQLSWNAPERTGTLSVHAPGEGIFVQTDIVAPPPLPLYHARCLAGDAPGGSIDDLTDLVAVSDRVESAGPIPTLPADARVLTPGGVQPVATLRPGAQVTLHDGNLAQVRWAGSAVVPAQGQLAPVRLRAPFFGLKRDICVAPDQRILVNGPELEFMFGFDQALISARHLIGHPGIRRVKPGGEIRYHQILLDRHGVMMVNGCPMGSFDMTSLADDPESLRHSVLAGMPPELRPADLTPARPLLRNYEAKSLSERLRAA